MVSTLMQRLTIPSFATPFTYCLPSSRRRAHDRSDVPRGVEPGPAPSFRFFFTNMRSTDREESRRLLSGQNNHGDDGGDEYRGGASWRRSRVSYDSDAISLLSDIADQDGARRGGAAASRRRRLARQQQRSRQRGCLGIGDVASSILACGLFGRVKRPTDHDGDDGDEGRWPTTRGAEREPLEDEGRSRHARSQSQDSQAISETGESRMGPQSGEEDAGSLGDDAIARLADSGGESEGIAQSTADGAPAQPDEGYYSEEIAYQQAKEEAELAAAEETVVAKARQRAERKAAKQRLIDLQKEHRSKWATEAEAEAAAGGFGFVEEADEQSQYEQSQWDQPAELPHRHGDDYHTRYEDYIGQGEQGHRLQAEYGQLRDEGNSQELQTVVQHHYYYDEAQEAQRSFEDEAMHGAFSAHLSPLPALPSLGEAEARELSGATQEPEEASNEEDDADIAGLGLSKRRRKSSKTKGLATSSNSGSYRDMRNNFGGSQSSGGSQSRYTSLSGGERRMFSETTTADYRATSSSSSSGSAKPKYLSPHLRSAGNTCPLASPRALSASVVSASSSSCSSSDPTMSAKPSYRNRPRRQQRSRSRSTNSSSAGGGSGRSTTRIVDTTATQWAPRSVRTAGNDCGRAESGQTSPSASATSTLGTLLDDVDEEERHRPRADAVVGGFDDSSDAINVYATRDEE